MPKPLEIVPAKKAEYVRTRTDKYFTKSREIVEKFGDRTVTYGVFMRRRVICAINPAIEALREYYPADAEPAQDHASLRGRRVCSRRQAALHLHRLLRRPARAGNADPAARGRRLRRRVQREPHGDEPPQDRVHRHARAPRDRRRHDPARGLRRLGRQPDGEARRGDRVRRHLAGPHRALLRRRARHRHHAARADRVRGLHAARGADVRRDPSRGQPHRAGRLLRARVLRRAGGLPLVVPGLPAEGLGTARGRSACASTPTATASPKGSPTTTRSRPWRAGCTCRTSTRRCAW